MQDACAVLATCNSVIDIRWKEVDSIYRERARGRWEVYNRTFDDVPNGAGIRKYIEYELWRILLLVHSEWFAGGLRARFILRF